MNMPHSIWWGLGVGVGTFLAFFIFEFSLEHKAERLGGCMTLTPFKQTRNRETGEITREDEQVDFDSRQGHYMKCGEVLIALASASLLFIPLHSALLTKVGLPGTLLGVAMILLGLSVVYTLLFMALMTYFYEMFLFNQYSFTAFRSSLMFALGFSGFASFALAYLALSVVAVISLTSQ
jgi:hypothetical protein